VTVLPNQIVEMTFLDVDPSRRVECCDESVVCRLIILPGSAAAPLLFDADDMAAALAPAAKRKSWTFSKWLGNFCAWQ
jgi:hypothetical protein